MFKQFVVAVSGISAVVIATVAAAIALGARQIGVCGNFTAGKYQVSPSNVTVRRKRWTCRQRPTHDRHVSLCVRCESVVS